MCGMRHICVLDVLGVEGCEARKDQDADGRDGKHHGRRLQEDVDHHCDDQTNHAHHQECAHPAQVFLGGVAPEAQAREGNRRHQEGLCDGVRCVHQKDRTHRNAHDGRKDEEAQLDACRRSPAHQRAPAKEDKGQRREHHDPAQGRCIERFAQCGQVDTVAQRHCGTGRVGCYGKAGDGPSGRRSDQHADRHAAVDFVHVGAQPGVDLGGACSGRRPDRIQLSHKRPPN
mmetsp:Transcript_33193/g.56405  ORF Transcript_33193/g.56405 Transcript_33193/m.56405 type:complete len:229 (+) Transcript_33193:182-868(+)